MILCLGTTPAAQRVMVFDQLHLNAVNRAVTTLDGAAGKAVNVAKVLKALGEEPLATGFSGGDRGEELCEILRQKGIETEFLSVEGRTRLCITVIASSPGAQTELVEESQPVSEHHYEQLKLIIQRRLKGCRAAVMSGTITPGGPVNFYYECTMMARELGAIPIVDAKGPALSAALKARPALVKPNRSELAATVGGELTDPDSVMRAMRELHTQGGERVVITDGSNPTLAFDGKRFWRVLPPEIQPLNPIGSGDAFTAALVWRLVRGDDLGECCRWGAAAGAANALTLMPGDLDPAEVNRLAAQVVVQSL